MVLYRQTAAATLSVLGMLALGACGDDGSAGDGTAPDNAPTDGGGGGEASVVEVDLDGADDAGPLVGAATVDDTTIAVTRDGYVIGNGDGDDWEPVDADGLPEPGGEDDADEDQEETVGGVAAGPDGYVAVGTLRFLVADAQPEQLVWTSSDGEEWESAGPDGLDGTGLGPVTSTGAELLAAGDTDDETTPALWASGNGEDWEQLNADGLEAGGSDLLSQLESMAAIDDVVLATGAVACVDDCESDYTTLFRSDDGGQSWAELAPDDTDGLESLENPFDEVPVVTVFGDGFALIGAGGDGESPVLTVWTSPDGTEWTEELRLDDTPLRTVQVATATETGLVALALDDGVLTVVEIATAAG